MTIPWAKLRQITPSEEISSRLFHGVPASELDSLLEQTLGSDYRSTSRMNLIGTLRSAGFVVSGGRAGGSEYRILDYYPIVPKPRIEWSPSQVGTLEWFNDLPPISESYADFVRHRLQSRDSSDHRHENTWSYLWGYELVGNTSARAHGKIYSCDDGVVIIKRMYQDRPRFSIIDLDASPEMLYRLVYTLSEVSFAPVKVINPSLPTLASDIISRARMRIETVDQPIYDLDALANAPENFFSRQSWKTARKMIREVQFEEIPSDTPGLDLRCESLIRAWKRLHEKDHPRLAIRRDSILAKTVLSRTKMAFVGQRNGEIVSLRILEPLANVDFVAGDMVEKSLNTSSLPGGHSGISDAFLVVTARHLSSRGIRFLNGGESASVGPKLSSYKKKFEVGRSRSITLVSRLPRGVE